MQSLLIEYRNKISTPYQENFKKILVKQIKNLQRD